MKLPKPKKLPSGSWNVNIMVDGRRVSVTRSTEKECVAAAAAIKAGMKQDQKRPKRITLYDAIDVYTEAKREALSPSTVRGYKIIREHRFQGLMKESVYSITKADVQKAVNDESKVCSPKTVKNAYGLIRPVLKLYGIDVFGVRLPQEKKPVKRYLQPEDIGRLIQVIEGDSCEIPILLAVWLGMRRSEISGLCWDCVDLENNILHIRRKVVPNEHNEWTLDDGAKNYTSQRSIQCPEYIMNKIKALPSREGQLFRMHPDTIRKHVHAACKKAGVVDTTVHGLRHTNAAVMKTLGIDDRHAMARGGWSCESTYRKTYSYVFASKATEADIKINDYFSSLQITDEITDKKA